MGEDRRSSPPLDKGGGKLWEGDRTGDVIGDTGSNDNVDGFLKDVADGHLAEGSWSLTGRKKEWAYRLHSQA